jgi:serine/threonine protein kinase
MKASEKIKVLNKNQCAHLYGKLILALKGIHKMLSSATKDLKFESIFEELCYLQKKVEILGKNCTEQERWCHSAIFQLHNKETFRELLLDLKCCYDITHGLYLFHHPNKTNDMLPIQFDAATYQEVFEDRQLLKKGLELVLQGEVSKDYEITQHLLLRLRNLDRVDGGDLDALEVPNDFKAPKLIKRIGEGLVHISNWLGLKCATKVLKGGREILINSQKELGILAGLSHPNLVQFVGCGINKNLDEIVEEDEMIEIYLVMELMESSLSTILRNQKRPLPYYVAIDIMHQIAKGVYYLHDMQVAHLDLKPQNVLASSISMEDLDPCRIFKLTDYGISQLEVCNNSKSQKTTNQPLKFHIGTRGYMSPEMIKGSYTSFYRFQADVWSFAMICSEILSGKVPYSGLKPKAFYDQISGTHGVGNKRLRPDLPSNCEVLTNLIQECWSQDPLQRPTFSNICERLTSLKKSFLKGTYSCKMVPQFDSPCTLIDSTSVADLVPKV